MTTVVYYTMHARKI